MDAGIALDSKFLYLSFDKKINKYGIQGKHLSPLKIHMIHVNLYTHLYTELIDLLQ